MTGTALSATTTQDSQSSKSDGAVVEPFLKHYAAIIDGDERERLLRSIPMRAMRHAPDEAFEQAGGLSYVDLADLDESALPPVLVSGLLVAGQAHWYMGHPESGKSTLALYVAREVMSDGMHVIWVDWEMGKMQAKRRAKAVGITDADLRERFHYTAYPAKLGAALGEGAAALHHDLERWPDALVVFDSCSKALSAAGLDENSNPDVTKWTTTVVSPLREVGATTLVVDHVTKGATRSQPYARGAGSKLADTDVEFYVEAEEKFSRTQAGTLRLTKHKDRESMLPDFTQRFSIGDANGGLPIEPIEGGAAGAGGDEAGRVRRDVADLLSRHDGEQLTTNQVCGMVVGRRQHKSDALCDLASDPSECFSAQPGPRGSVLYRFDAAAATALPV